jgi:serine protease Do
MNPSKFYLFRKRATLSVLAVAAAGGIAWSATALNASPSVNVKVDDRPITEINNTPAASYAPVVKRVSPSVVKVLVTERAKRVPAGDLPSFFDSPQFRQFFGDQFGRQFGRRGTILQPPQEGLGSGVIVSPDGYILTNNHVVRGADVIKVTLNDGRELTAKVVGTDPESDIAVVKVDAKDLPAITFADSEKLQVGDRVLAIGNPFGIGQTVTSGMVSGLGRATLGLGYEDFIQTDAAINPGNSGGALVDVDGRLVGINTAILSRSGGFQGIGFAIPSNMAQNVMEQLVTKGKVVRGYLGVTVQDITPALADQFNVKNHEGAIVAEVVRGSPAAKAGLQSGDVITKLDGKEVADARRLKLASGALEPGKQVAVQYVRDGKTQTAELTVGKRPSERELARNGGGQYGNDYADNGDNDTGTLNGVGVADLDPQARREFDVPARVHGALVTEVDPNSASAQAGLQPGDVIEEINHHPVHSGDDAVRLTENPESKKTLLRVWSQRGSHYIVVDETDTGDQSGAGE